MEKNNRWQWFNGKICQVQLMNPLLLCNREHNLILRGSPDESGQMVPEPAMSPVMRGRVTIDGSVVLIEAALDSDAPEFIWTFGLHEGDIASMVVVEKKLITS
jgi:hypothetical protein